jgi:hypothetical protein
MDLRSTQGVLEVLSLVEAYGPVHLWGAIPCSPWSTLQSLNLAKLGSDYADKLRRKRRESMRLLRNFFRVAKKVLEHQGHVHFEWPAYNSGWQLEELQQFLAAHNMGSVIIHGCMLDVQDPHGKPMKKPWRIASTHSGLLHTLSRYVCDGAREHTPCMGGSNAPLSAFYPANLPG